MLRSEGLLRRVARDKARPSTVKTGGLPAWPACPSPASLPETTRVGQGDPGQPARLPKLGQGDDSGRPRFSKMVEGHVSSWPSFPSREWLGIIFIVRSESSFFVS